MEQLDGIGGRERWELVDHLAGDPKDGSARHDQTKLRTGGQQVGQPGHRRVHDVLDVVDHQQSRTIPEQTGHLVELAQPLRPQSSGEGIDDTSRAGAAEIDEPHR